MPASIGFDIELPDAEREQFLKVLSRYQKETQRDSYDSLRSTTIDLIKSLRARTARAPKLLPKKAFRFGNSSPQWYTNKVTGDKYRRMVRKGFPNSNRQRQQGDFVFWQPVRIVYKARRTKRGISESWTEQNEAQLIRDAREKYGRIANRGLAKHTWGWMMWRLFNIPGGNDGFENRRVRITHRHAEATLITTREPLPDGTIDLQAPLHAEVTLINRLRYIRKALPPGALSAAVTAAVKSMNAKIDKGLKSRKFAQ